MTWRSRSLASGPRISSGTAGLCLALLLVSSAGCESRPAAKTAVTRQTIRISGVTPDRTGVDNARSLEDLAKLYRRSLPDFDFVVISGWSDESLDALHRGDADLAIVSADRAYAQYVRHEGDSRGARETLRGMALLWPTPVHVIAGPQSGIHSVRDLAGRRIGRVRVTLITARLVLTAFGVPRHELMAENLSLQDGLAQLMDGRLDALIVVIDAGRPELQTAIASGARLISVDADHARQIHREYPFFALRSLPAGTYPNQPHPVHSLGISALLVCRQDLSEELVYALTKFYFGFLFSRSEGIPFFNPRSASATPIPLHDGARRYYREMELLR